MGERKGKISLLVAVVGLFLALASGALALFAYIGAPLGFIHSTLELAHSTISFASDGAAWGLVPLPLILLGISVMLFSLRKGKRSFFFLIPLVIIMAYTLYTLSHLVGQSTRPYLGPWLLERSGDFRSASLRMVIAFLVEMVLFIAVVLIADALAHMKVLHKQHKEARQAKGPKKTRKKAKTKKREKLDPDVEGAAQEETSPFDVVDIPPLESFGRRRSAPIAVDPSQEREVGRVSTGALHTLNEERKRNNGVTFLEQRQQSQEQAPSKPAKELSVKPARERGKKHDEPLSGFLVGALEAIGKPSKKKPSAAKIPQGKARGILAEAVQRQEVDTPPAMVIKEQVVSVTYDESPVEVVPAAPVEPVREPTKRKPLFERSAAPAAPQPVVNQPSPTPPAASQESAEDEFDSSSGVGGLVQGEGKSYLLNPGKIGYKYPPETMLDTYEKIGDVVDAFTIKRGELLVATLSEFSISVELTNIVRGPTVTMFELLPAPGVRVNSIANLSDNIALALAATTVRIVAPIPGKSAVGVEIPNAKRDIIGFREMLGFLSAKQGVPMVLGRDLLNRGVVIDVVQSPHLLIAGSTGSGKSVCVNSLICSILFKRSPREVRLILVDPKIVELNVYNGIPHLLTPVITDAKRTLKALDFALYEMDRRYRLLQSIGVRNIVGYNEKIKANNLARERLPYIVIIIDEFADLMHLVGKEMETKVSRLAAMSRAVGIHLVLATQRPSVDVITGVIKNNIPTRIAFAVTSSTDSRIILDEMGAEKLLGRGDMLYQSATEPASIRIQGSFLSDQEVEQIVDFVSRQGRPDFIDESFFEEDEPKAAEASSGSIDASDDEALMEEALAIVVERKSASASYLQRRLKIGYNRAARLVEQMEEMGYVGPPNGSKPRELIKYP